MSREGLTGKSRTTGPSGLRTYGLRSLSGTEGSNHIIGLSQVRNRTVVLLCNAPIPIRLNTWPIPSIRCGMAWIDRCGLIGASTWSRISSKPFGLGGSFPSASNRRATAIVRSPSIFSTTSRHAGTRTRCKAMNWKISSRESFTSSCRWIRWTIPGHFSSVFEKRSSRVLWSAPPPGFGWE